MNNEIIQTAIFDKAILDDFTGNVIITRRDKMVYGKIIKGIISDHENKDISNCWNIYLIEARFYKPEQEIKVFFRKNELYYRIRKKEEENEYAIKNQQILSGTTFEDNGDFIMATEDRGTCIYIPKDAIENLGSNTTKQLNDNKNRIALSTITYVGFENNLATLVDTQLVNYKII
mgnify:CR=1 FL=1